LSFGPTISPVAHVERKATAQITAIVKKALAFESLMTETKFPESLAMQAREPLHAAVARRSVDDAG
jgi:hypothetical protein